MALKYSLVLRKDLRKEAQEGSMLYFGQVRSSDRITFVELCDLISARSTASSGDVKLVIDGLLTALKLNLSKGNIVDFGELGSFRMTAGSIGSPLAEDFSSRLFKKGKIVFTPGADLRELCATLNFEKLTFVPGTSEDDKE